MPQTGISCLSDGLKAILMEESGHIENPRQRQEFETTVQQVPSCPVGMLIGLEAGKSGGKKRAPSAYNEWIRKCASKKEKGGMGKPFKECALEYKRNKGASNAR